MDLTGLYNAIMQLIFIITGLVSIKSLTEMITQLVGQGDALKDGADTMKEAKKMAGQATGAVLHAGGLAMAGVKGVAGVAGRVAGSPAGQALREKAGDAAASVSGAVGNRWNNYVSGHDNALTRGVEKRRDRLAADNKFVNANMGANAMTLKAQQERILADKLDAAGDTAGATAARNRAALMDRGAQRAKQAVQDMRENGVNGRDVSRRGVARAFASDMSMATEHGTVTAKNWYAKGSKAVGFEDGFGIKAAIKGDKNKDTAINQFLYGTGKRDADGKIVARPDETSIYNNIKNTNKFVFNVTGMKGDVKDFLDNADVLETIEAGDTALARQMKELIGHTGAKSDLKKAEQASEGQAKATAKQMAAQTDAINSTMASISQQLEEIKKKLP